MKRHLTQMTLHHLSPLPQITHIQPDRSIFHNHRPKHILLLFSGAVHGFNKHVAAAGLPIGMLTLVDSDAAARATMTA